MIELVRLRRAYLAALATDASANTAAEWHTRWP